LSVEPPRATVKYQVEGTVINTGGLDPFDFVAALAIATIPATFAHPLGTLNLQDIQIHENHAGRIYSITAPYAQKKKESGAYQITVDQSGSMINVKAGTRISSHFDNAGLVAPETNDVNNHGLIGVNGDEIEGVDIPVEETKLQVNFRHPQGILNKAYIKAVGRLVGYPNSVPFLGYDIGEVVYIGGQFVETDTEATATYSFAVSYNQTNLVIGGITVTEKHGWDVLSFSYFDKVETGNLTKKIKCIEVVRPAGREWKDYVATFGWGAT